MAKLRRFAAIARDFSAAVRKFAFTYGEQAKGHYNPVLDMWFE